MSTRSNPSTSQPLTFRVRFRGKMNASWFATLQDATPSSTQTGGVTETTLIGNVPDEAALIGIVNLLYDLGCSLVSVESMGPGVASDSRGT